MVLFFMSCDAPDQLVFEAMTRLAARHDSSEWREIGDGGNVLVLPLSDLQKDPDVDVAWQSEPPAGPLRVQIAKEPMTADLQPVEAGWAIAVPGTDRPEEGVGQIRFEDQSWTLYVTTRPPTGLEALRSIKPPEADEIEDLDAREKWFKDRH